MVKVSELITSRARGRLKQESAEPVIRSRYSNRMGSVITVHCLK